MFIKKEINNYICTLKIKREDALNAVNPTVLKELHYEVEIAKDSKIRIGGAGKFLLIYVFCDPWLARRIL